MAEGDKLWAEKKYREASFAYQDAVNADPSGIEALFKLGIAYAVLGYYSQAIDKWTLVQQNLWRPVGQEERPGQHQQGAAEDGSERRGLPTGAGQAAGVGAGGRGACSR